MRSFKGFCLAVISLLCTWLFFHEYIPPSKTVHLWSDIEGYHYPLLNYAHKSLAEGRLPLWDPSIYCGVPFAGNIQAGLFYPPNWLLFAANADLPAHLRGPDVNGDGYRGRHGMRFTSVEILAFVHVWLAFLFTFFWLRERTGNLPAAFAAIGAACGGYLLSQMNHLGVSCAYPWVAFALWGIEQTHRQRAWQPLWKVAVGSAMCLLAGYPPTWVAFAVIAFTYAIALPSRKRLIPLLVVAFVLSAAVGAVQLVPAFEAAKSKVPEIMYGAELPFGNALFVSFLLPNYFDQNRITDGPDLQLVDYQYLGVPALFGLIWFIRRGWFPGAGPAIAIAGAVLFVAADPFGWILRVIPHLPIVPDVLRRYNFIVGVPLAAALLAASALADFLRRSRNRAIPRWVQWCWAVAVGVWILYLLRLWPPGGPDFVSGLASAIYPIVLLLLFGAGLWLYGARQNPAVVLLLILVVLVDFKAFGTNRRFNAVTCNVDVGARGDARVGGHTLLGLDDAVYWEMLRHPGYRVALHEGPNSTDLRLYGLTTPQGFDPFLSSHYKAVVESFQPFKTNRLFDIDPLNEEMLRHFGVRWVMLHGETPMKATLSQHPAFKLLRPDHSYFNVFEYLHAEPAWKFSGRAQMTAWDPEHRAFRVNSDTGGRFILREQLFPGWKVSVDGAPAENERAEGAFQAVLVPPGDHTLEFRYQPLSFRIGAVLSALGVGAVVLIATRRRKTMPGGY